MSKITLKIEASYLKDIIRILISIFFILIITSIYIGTQDIKFKWYVISALLIINGWILAKLYITVKDFLRMLKKIKLTK